MPGECAGRSTSPSRPPARPQRTSLRTGSAAEGYSALMPDDHFGESVAARYDTSVEDMFDHAVVDPTVRLLAALASGGPALELGIGTGRVALPLSRAGVEVHGIDLSTAMLARLR